MNQVNLLFVNSPNISIQQVLDILRLYWFNYKVLLQLQSSLVQNLVIYFKSFISYNHFPLI